MPSRSGSGIASRCSIVRYATQRRGSSTNGRHERLRRARRRGSVCTRRSARGWAGRARARASSRPRREARASRRPGTMSRPFLPTNPRPGARRPGALEHRRVVAERSRLRGRLGASERAHELRELAELLAKAVVVVATAGVASDRARELGVGCVPPRRAAAVATRDADDALRAEEDVVAVERRRASRDAASHDIPPCMPSSTNAS